MEKKRSFKVFSAALLAAAVLCGCTDHNSGSYTEKADSSVVTTTWEIADWTLGTTENTETTETTASTTTKKVKTTKTNTKKKQQQKKTTTTEAYTEPVTTAVTDLDDGTYVEYHFRSKKLLNQHFEKHGSEFKDDFGYSSAEDYEKGASDVINNREALHKTEAEDGDGVYYIEATNEFVILSTDGYIRTYFRPNGGKSYYDRQ